ncbi:MAG: class I SAM-dependent methyltransferase [Theionarchaea archaeon]|nr:class I SAM-dependent methyltransferase [Theionarchaea archaeon]MBU7036405.1 class I SAM-dependent methyltransferase [Theionarchaea archaeon]
MDQPNLVRQIFATTGSTYDLMVKVATLGQDSSWKKRILEISSQITPKTILDLACGTGILTFALAQRFPESAVVGIDLQEEYLLYARAKKIKSAVKNVEFFQANAEDVVENRYDLITASYLPKYINMNVVIRNCSKILNPEGLIVFHDFTYPENAFYRLTYNIYWVLLRSVLHMSQSWREMGRELKHIIVESTWVTTMKSALEVHGFTEIQVEIQPWEVSAIVYATRRGTVH